MATLSQDDLNKLKDVFGEWGLQAKIESPEDLKNLMLQSQSIKKEPTETSRVRDEPRRRLEVPKLPYFSGKVEPNGTPYDVWRYDVECLQSNREYSEDMIAEAIRRSLKGDAAMVMVRLGSKASRMELLMKLDGLYGNVATESSLLTQFYAANQREGEDIAAWSLRLENLIQKVQDQGLISAGTRKEMLRTKIWTGLTNEELKHATRHRYDTIRDVDELIIVLRSMEQETLSMKKPDREDKKKVKVQAIQKTETDLTQKTLQDLGDRLEKIEKDIKEIKQKQEHDFSQNDQRHTEHYGSSFTRGRGQGRGRGRGRYGRWSETRSTRDEDSSELQLGKEDTQTEVTCYRCGQKGHIALGCRVRTDHLRHLNAESPLRGGKQ